MGGLTLDPTVRPGGLTDIEGLESVEVGGLNLSTPWAVSLLNSAGVSTRGFPWAVIERITVCKYMWSQGDRLTL